MMPAVLIETGLSSRDWRIYRVTIRGLEKEERSALLRSPRSVP